MKLTISKLMVLSVALLAGFTTILGKPLYDGKCIIIKS